MHAHDIDAGKRLTIWILLPVLPQIDQVLHQYEIEQRNARWRPRPNLNQFSSCQDVINGGLNYR
jgi:hypothetical protein